MDVFDALNGISDFTLGPRPDVVFVTVDSVTDSFQLLSTLFRQSDEGELEFPIFALSGCDPEMEDCDVFEGSLAQITAKLEEIVPGTSAAAS